MKFASTIQAGGDGRELIAMAAARIAEELDPQTADQVFVFASAHFEDEFDVFARCLREHFPRAHFLGCSAEGIIGNEQEIERTPAMTVMAASLPGVRIDPVRIDPTQPDMDEHSWSWMPVTNKIFDDPPHMVLLADPFSFLIYKFLQDWDRSYPGSAVVGGMASSAETSGQNALLLNDRVYRNGAVGIIMSGNVILDTVVSQGCSAIGDPLVVTKADQNLILELNDRPALAYLEELAESLTSDLVRRARQVLLLGKAVDNGDKGDSAKNGGDNRRFIIHNLLGADSRTGAVAVSAYIERGATIQFQIRDAESADEDLARALDNYLTAPEPPQPHGTLLFSDHGRGTKLWTEPDHDARALRNRAGGVPTTGFLAAAEFGPVSAQNAVHAGTASIGLFRPAHSAHDPLI